jgi:flagellar protein FliL
LGADVAEEAKKEKEKEEAAPSAAKKMPSGDPPKPILLIIVVVLNMLVMVSVAMILWTAHKAEQAKPKLQDVVEGVKQEEAQKAEAEEHQEFIGKLVPMETFLVNLAGTRGNKVVKINMELEVDNVKVEEEIEKRKPQIRDIIIILLSSKTYDQMTSKEGKESLRDEVRDTVSSFLVKGKIQKVYFTDFIVN